MAEYVAGEWLSLLQTLNLLLAGKWVSQPTSIIQAKNKLYQLTQAEGLGFTVPETLVTMLKSSLRNFNIVTRASLFGSRFFLACWHLVRVSC